MVNRGLFGHTDLEILGTIEHTAVSLSLNGVDRGRSSTGLLTPVGGEHLCEHQGGLAFAGVLLFFNFFFQVQGQI